MTRFLAALALIATQAHAQTPRCTTHDDMVKKLADKYGESRRVLGTSRAALMEVFHNPETGTWTLVVTGTNGISCIRAAGRYLQIEQIDEAT